MDITTTLCYHDISVDQFVSDSIAKKGVWEANLLTVFLMLTKKTNSQIVFDIGAQLGQYSLFAAKLVPKVISVEPFYDNVIRFHKAVQLENLADRITLVTNAVSNKSNEWKLLQKVDKNIGGQSLLPKNQLQFDQKDVAIYKEYLVRTILMDDLTELVEPKYHKATAIMKVDIEGFEVFAFQRASKLFDLLDFKAVFMEWLIVGTLNRSDASVPWLIEFFTTRGYSVFDSASGAELNSNSWKTWPGDVIWLRSAEFQSFLVNNQSSF